MAVYAISDLHLSFGVNKPMDVFGGIWKDYENKLKNNWNKVVSKDDTVIICGDVSWGTYLSDTVKDFEYIDDLNGNKIILRGNHDYYFQTLTKMNNFFKYNRFDTLSMLHNNFFDIENYIICGTRGYEKKDLKIFNREVERLKLSLDKGIELQKKYLDKGVKKDLIVATHYPPFEEEFIDVLKKYNVKKCVYGHLHRIWIKKC